MPTAAELIALFVESREGDMGGKEGGVAADEVLTTSPAAKGGTVEAMFHMSPPDTVLS